MTPNLSSHKKHKTPDGTARLDSAYRRAALMSASGVSLFVFFVATPSGPSAHSAPFVAHSFLSA